MGIKMDDEKVSKFKVNFDDETPAELLPEEIHDVRVGKLNRRITFVALLAPILAAAMIFFAYQDIKKNLAKTQTDGVSQFQTFADDMEKRLTDLSAKVTQVETSLNDTGASIEKSISAVRAELEKAKKQIAKLDADKLSKKETPNVQAQIDKAIAPSLEKLQKLDADLTKKLTDQTKTMGDVKSGFDALKADIKKIKDDVSTLSKRKIDKATLDLEFLKEKKNLQVKFETMSKKIDEKLNQFEKKMDRISKTAKGSRNSSGPQTSQAKKPPPKGKIVEEQISE
jgi:archaellum component FlaC